MCFKFKEEVLGTKHSAPHTFHSDFIAKINVSVDYQRSVYYFLSREILLRSFVFAVMGSRGREGSVSMRQLLLGRVERFRFPSKACLRAAPKTKVFKEPPVTRNSAPFQDCISFDSWENVLFCDLLWAPAQKHNNKTQTRRLLWRFIPTHVLICQTDALI